MVALLAFHGADIVEDDERLLERLAEWLKERRRFLKMTQGEMAAALTEAGWKCSLQAVSSWENAQRLPPFTDPIHGGQAARVFARVYKVPAWKLLELLGTFEKLPPGSVDEIVKKLPADLLVTLDQASPEQIKLFAKIARLILTGGESLQD